jgi:hypothetical protein
LWVIRLALLKIAALITIGVRRVRIAMASACPNQRSFKQAWVSLAAAAR